MKGGNARPSLLLVGGGAGLIGRHVLAEFSKDWRIVSLHRRAAPSEAVPGVEFVSGDVTTLTDWAPVLSGVDLVVNVAWYRTGSVRRFRPLTDGLLRLVAAAEAAGTPRFIHISVPDAPASLETHLPYMVLKREVDRAIERSRLSYAIVRPTMVFAPHDKLLTVMLRTMARYHRFPMFGKGEYHLSPVAAPDLARIVRREASLPGRHNVTVGGPRRWRYRDLTDAMFSALGLRPKYVSLSERNAVRLARFLEAVGSSLLYAYEVEWLVSDMLGLDPYEGLDPPMHPVEPFLLEEAARLRGTEPAR
jgi:uncharacterized protein YbjT (DUF2867 family)